jgi:ribosomal protein S18 acetylase RimI-like enzyme
MPSANKMNEMKNTIDPQNIRIRTALRPGDLGYLIYLHGHLYGIEYQYGISFEIYVAQGVYEFYQQYDPQKDRVWICEDGDRIVGFMLLMHREKNTAQLRYFILEPDYRGIGLGKRLMTLFMDHLRDEGYQHAYLWTTSELGTAAALYTRHGFRLTEEKRSDAFGKPLYEQRYDLDESVASTP